MSISHRLRDVLVKEVEGLRRPSAPAFVHRLSSPRPVAAIAAEHQSAGRDIVLLSPSEPMYEMDVSVTGAVEGPYSLPCSFRLTFPFDYPSNPPRVRATSIFHHYALHQDDKEFPLVYTTENLRRCEGEEDQGADGASEGGVEYSLTSTLEALHSFLLPPSWPLHMLEGLNAAEREQANAQRERLLDQYEAVAGHNRRRENIIKNWASRSRHQELLEGDFQSDWLHSDLLRILPGLSLDGQADVHTAREKLAEIVEEVCEGVYTFPLLSTLFCDKLMDEVEDYQKSGLPIRRPNSMNNYGIIVNEIGMEAAITCLQQKVLQPIARLLFPVEGFQFDGHHSFMVQYKHGEDLGLDIHTDDSDVTFNACLGKEFTGAGLTLCGMMGSAQHRAFSASYKHRKGYAIVHKGRHRHGADDIVKGERMNLIIWNHNSVWRKTSEYTHLRLVDEASPPDLRCLSYTHDRDYEKFQSLPPAALRGGKRKGWYPPRGVKVPTS